MKKLASLLLCVLLAAALAVPALAADTTVFTITPDKTSAGVGEEITFTVSISGTNEYRSMGIIMQYDSSVFEVVGGEATMDALFKTFDADKGLAYLFQDPGAYEGQIGYFILRVIAECPTTATVTGQTAVKAGQTSFESTVNTVSINITGEHTWDAGVTAGATCATPGSTTYTCTKCGAANVVEGEINPGNHPNGLTHVEAKEATCYEAGNVEYWYCADCGYAWLDEACTQVTNLKSVILPVTHSVEHVEAKAPICDEDGNIEYWYCTDCGYAWLDEYCTQNTNLKSVILPATGHTVEHVAAVAPDCYTEGNIEYWYCTTCGYAWLDEDCTLNTNLKSVILPTTEHEIEHVAAKDATCYEEGNVEYWYCTNCGYAWLDEDCTQVTNLKSVILPVTHDLVHVEAKEAGCWEDGNIEYWYCTECGFAWLDEYCTKNTNLKAVVLPAAHNIEHVEAKSPICDEDGNIEYWYCTECGYAWLDEDCTKNTNLKAVILPATGHTVEHVAAKDATCEENGNLEYWYCTECGYAWLDKDCTRNTNLKSVILPAIGHDYECIDNKDGKTHTPVCANCGDKKDAEKHNMHEVIVKESTYTEKGEAYKVCEDCGYKTEKYELALKTNDYDDVPKTGDITGQIVLFTAAVVAMFATVAVVIKRRVVR